jgi:CheY-like chemotaxis protein
MKPIHILLIEDNEGDIILTRNALEDGKIINSLAVVKDGSKGIEYLEKKTVYIHEPTPDLILLDFSLPKLDGIEVLKIIKSNNTLKNIPVVLLTASSFESEFLNQYKEFVNIFISKPVDTKNFLEAISAIDDFWISIVQLPKQIKK